MFSPGVLHSARRFISLVGGLDVTAEEFPRIYKQYEVADSTLVLSVSQQCDWVRVDENGFLTPTARGGQLAEISDYRHCMREQLIDLIKSENPPWSRFTSAGRGKTIEKMPPDAFQCIKESELHEGIGDDVVDWWDKAALIQQGRAGEATLRSGRTGERLSIQYETSRTGIPPEWVALETNVPGYDLSSKKSKRSKQKLRIEVKATTNNLNNGFFFLTRNEFRSASRNPDEYVVHLWVLNSPPQGYYVTPDELTDNTPTDNGDGEWDRLKMHFRTFKKNRLVARHIPSSLP